MSRRLVGGRGGFVMILDHYSHISQLLDIVHTHVVASAQPWILDDPIKIQRPNTK